DRALRERRQADRGERGGCRSELKKANSGGHADAPFHFGGSDQASDRKELDRLYANSRAAHVACQTHIIAQRCRKSWHWAFVFSRPRPAVIPASAGTQ